MESTNGVCIMHLGYPFIEEGGANGMCMCDIRVYVCTICIIDGFLVYDIVDNGNP